MPAFDAPGKRRPINAVAVAKMLRAMLTENLGYKELGEVSGLNRKTIERWLTPMRAEKLVCIGEWGEDPRGIRIIPLFKFAPDEPNVRRPKPLTGAQRAKRVRDKYRTDKLYEAITGVSYVTANKARKQTAHA